MVASSIAELAAAVRDGDRAALPRAITLVESTRADHRDQAQQLLLELMPDAGRALHVGITGVPGVGKSTTIEALGHVPHRAGPPGRRAGGRPVVHPDGRLHPRRQDPHGATGRAPRRLHPPLADVGHARRGRQGDSRDHRSAGGGGLRRHPG